MDSRRSEKFEIVRSVDRGLGTEWTAPKRMGVSTRLKLPIGRFESTKVRRETGVG